MTVYAETPGPGRAQQAADIQRAATEQILAVADQAGYRTALISGPADGSAPGDASRISGSQFALMVRTAASGLSRRGVQTGDKAGIFVADAASHVLAVHAVRAAGAIAVPLRPGNIVTQLKECRARVLITSAGLAVQAVEAAERSWVRQVFSFGDADGTTPFGSLLNPGQPDPRSADLALDERGDGGLSSREVIVAAPPGGHPDTYTSLLDEALAAGATIVAVPLAQVTAAVRTYRAAAAITPAGRTPGAFRPAEPASTPRP
jgi:acyl-CoA synthetase (AMP-forming)/AMP-acid ligase II